MTISSPSSTDASIRILLVEDDPRIRAGLTRILRKAGYEVTPEEDVPGARQLLAAGGYDVVLTDLGLPSGSGLEVVEAAREHDRAMPVVVVSANGDLDVARTAVARGALRFLTKPVDAGRLIGAVEEACRTRAAVALALGTARSQRIRVLDPDLLRVRTGAAFERALGRLWMALQPIASVVDGRVTGYEALMRSDDLELSRPDQLLAAAEDLGRVHELGRAVRAASAAHLRGLPLGRDLLVNLHAADLLDPELYDPSSPLARDAGRVILEITERASFTELPDLSARLASLRGLGYRLAIDDLGAGYGSLSALALVRPELVKLDMSLIRDLDRDPVRREVVRSIGAMCDHLDTTWLCEGVETPAELAAVIDAGTHLVQGYLLGRPARTPAAAVAPEAAAILIGSQRVAAGAGA